MKKRPPPTPSYRWGHPQGAAAGAEIPIFPSIIYSLSGTVQGFINTMGQTYMFV